jgi:putative transposase
VRFPRFKSKHRSARSVRFTTGAIGVEPDRHHVLLPRIGRIHTHESTGKLARRQAAGTARILSATVSYQAGRWWCAFQVLVADKVRPAHAGRSPHRVVGVDIGVGDLLVVATPEGVELDRIPAPRPLMDAQNRLLALQHRASRQHGPYDSATKSRREPSNRWLRTQTRIGRVHARIANIRAHEIHVATTALASRHEVVVVEQLAVKNMSRRGGDRKRGLNRALGDAALGRLCIQLHYKTTWFGAELVTAPRLFPSTQLCSRCGEKTKLALRDRIYCCRSGCPPIDRDLNAAINLARLGDANSGERGPVPGVDRPPATGLEMDVEPTSRPAPTPRWRDGRRR